MAFLRDITTLFIYSLFSDTEQFGGRSGGRFRSDRPLWSGKTQKLPVAETFIIYH